MRPQATSVQSSALMKCASWALKHSICPAREFRALHWCRNEMRARIMALPSSSLFVIGATIRSGLTSPLRDLVGQRLQLRLFRSSGRTIHLGKSTHFTEFERSLGRSGRKQMHHTGDDAGPAGLMAGAKTGSVVAVEVLIEQN